nr:MAG TPA: hypothetical protein [Caudoviricetes sp.]
MLYITNFNLLVTWWIQSTKELLRARTLMEA